MISDPDESELALPRRQAGMKKSVNDFVV